MSELHTIVDKLTETITVTLQLGPAPCMHRIAPDIDGDVENESLYSLEQLHDILERKTVADTPDLALLNVLLQWAQNLHAITCNNKFLNPEELIATHAQLVNLFRTLDRLYSVNTTETILFDSGIALNGFFNPAEKHYSALGELISDTFVSFLSSDNHAEKRAEKSNAESSQEGERSNTDSSQEGNDRVEFDPFLNQLNETIRQLLHDYQMEVEPAHLRTENQRLTSENESNKAEIRRAHAEIERLRTELRQASVEMERLRAEKSSTLRSPNALRDPNAMLYANMFHFMQTPRPPSTAQAAASQLPPSSTGKDDSSAATATGGILDIFTSML